MKEKEKHRNTKTEKNKAGHEVMQGEEEAGRCRNKTMHGKRGRNDEEQNEIERG